MELYFPASVIKYAIYGSSKTFLKKRKLNEAIF